MIDARKPQVDDARRSDGPITGERRQVTALFYDLVNSTGMLHALDAEDVLKTQRVVHQIAFNVINRFGGYLDFLQGDGGCAYFGYPRPMEDAAECAVRAALEILKQCLTIGGDAESGYSGVRIGVATGLVIIDEIDAATGFASQPLTGLAPNLASRAQSEADANAIAVAALTHDLTRSIFEYRSLGERKLKGFEKPQALYQPIRAYESHDRFSVRRRIETPFVSRAEELDFLLRHWSAARAGSGRVVVVSGEAGIGKSRLIAEFQLEIGPEDGDVLLLQCQPRGNSVPLHPLVNRLRSDLDHHFGQGAPVDAEAVAGMFAARGLAVEQEQADALARVLVDDRRWSEAALGEASSLGTAAARAFADLIAGSAERKPLCLVVEDLHWADSLTLDFISGLAESATHQSLLAIATTRETESLRLAERPQLLELSLPRLDIGGTSRMLGAVWPTPEPPSGLARYVHDRSDGIPLLAEELIDLVKLRGHDGASNWELTLGIDELASLKDLLAARLADNGSARRTALLASVVGRQFSADRLKGLLGDPGADRRLERELATLVANGILRERPSPLGVQFEFRHVMLQEVAYESLLKRERRTLHGKLAHMFLADRPPDVPLEIVAWHCEQAGLHADASRTAVAAAESCLMRSAPLEASKMLDVAERNLAKAGNDDELTLQLLAVRGPTAAALHGNGSPEAAAVYGRAIALCQSMPSEDRERWFSLYWGWWFTAQDFGAQSERATALLRDLEQARESEVRLQMYHCAWATSFHSGRHSECLARIERGLACYDAERAHVGWIKYGGHDAKVCALAERALSLWLMGHEAAAFAAIAQAIDWAEQIGHTVSLCHALDFALNLHRYRGDHATVADVGARLCSLSQAHGLVNWQVRGAIFVAWAEGLREPSGVGLVAFETALDRHRTIGTREDMPVYYDMWAELLATAARPGDALERIDEAIGNAEATGDVFWLPALLRRRALMRERLGEAPRIVVRDLAASVDAAIRVEAKALEAVALADLNRLRGLA